MNRDENSILKYISELIVRYPILIECKKDIKDSYSLMVDSFQKGGKILIAGNGGSAADSEHMVGELMKNFMMQRHIPTEIVKKVISIDPVIGEDLSKHLQSAIPAISLSAHEAFTTAYTNDGGKNSEYAQQVYGYGKKGDIFLGISTSGNSANVVYAAVIAKALGIKTIGITGISGGMLGSFCDVCIRVPEKETYRVQELHLPIYHCLCRMLEEYFFGLGVS